MYEPLGVILGDLIDGIHYAMDMDNDVTKTARITWATDIEKWDVDYISEYKVPPGSIIFGLEWLEDGKKCTGTLKIQPKKLYSKVS